MRMTAFFLAVALPVTMIASSPASAGRNNNAKILLHIAEYLSCKRMAATGNEPTCSQIVTRGDLYPAVYQVSLLVTDASAGAGVQSVSCGIEYGSGAWDGIGIDIWMWSLCWPYSKSEIRSADPPWPEDGSWNTITWVPDACQRYEPGLPGTGVVAHAGWFYLASYPDPATDNVSRLRVTPRGYDGLAVVRSCETPSVIDTVAGGSIQVPSRLGYVTFSPGATEPGYNPCGLITAVTNTTWSRLKLLREP